mmetsp:Transcript_6441/g.15917  ORF Transcript_6441/g.15917 Transcript_6441/m.15917 type:complete len:1168 (-) Transcript_6441:137-3640(-)
MSFESTIDQRTLHLKQRMETHSSLCPNYFHRRTAPDRGLCLPKNLGVFSSFVQTWICPPPISDPDDPSKDQYPKNVSCVRYLLSKMVFPPCAHPQEGKFLPEGIHFPFRDAERDAKDMEEHKKEEEQWALIVQWFKKICTTPAQQTWTGNPACDRTIYWLFLETRLLWKGKEDLIDIPEDENAQLKERMRLCWKTFASQVPIRDDDALLHFGNKGELQRDDMLFYLVSLVVILATGHREQLFSSLVQDKEGETEFEHLLFLLSAVSFVILLERVETRTFPILPKLAFHDLFLFLFRLEYFGLVQRLVSFFSPFSAFWKGCDSRFHKRIRNLVSQNITRCEAPFTDPNDALSFRNNGKPNWLHHAFAHKYQNRDLFCQITMQILLNESLMMRDFSTIIRVYQDKICNNPMLHPLYTFPFEMSYFTFLVSENRDVIMGYIQEQLHRESTLPPNTPGPHLWGSADCIAFLLQTLRLDEEAIESDLSDEDDIIDSVVNTRDTVVLFLIDFLTDRSFFREHYLLGTGSSGRFREVKRFDVMLAILNQLSLDQLMLYLQKLIRTISSLSLPDEDPGWTNALYTYLWVPFYYAPPMFLTQFDKGANRNTLNNKFVGFVMDNLIQAETVTGTDLSELASRLHVHISHYLAPEQLGDVLCRDKPTRAQLVLSARKQFLLDQIEAGMMCSSQTMREEFGLLATCPPEWIDLSFFEDCLALYVKCVAMPFSRENVAKVTMCEKAMELFLESRESDLNRPKFAAATAKCLYHLHDEWYQPDKTQNGKTYLNIMQKIMVQQLSPLLFSFYPWVWEGQLHTKKDWSDTWWNSIEGGEGFQLMDIPMWLSLVLTHEKDFAFLWNERMAREGYEGNAVDYSVKFCPNQPCMRLFILHHLLSTEENAAMKGNLQNAIEDLERELQIPPDTPYDLPYIDKLPLKFSDVPKGMAVRCLVKNVKGRDVELLQMLGYESWDDYLRTIAEYSGGERSLSEVYAEHAFQHASKTSITTLEPFSLGETVLVCRNRHLSGLDALRTFLSEKHISLNKLNALEESFLDGWMCPLCRKSMGLIKGTHWLCMDPRYFAKVDDPSPWMVGDKVMGRYEKVEDETGRLRFRWVLNEGHPELPPKEGFPAVVEKKGFSQEVQEQMNRRRAGHREKEQETERKRKEQERKDAFPKRRHK